MATNSNYENTVIPLLRRLILSVETSGINITAKLDKLLTDSQNYGSISELVFVDPNGLIVIRTTTMNSEGLKTYTYDNINGTPYAGDISLLKPFGAVDRFSSIYIAQLQDTNATINNALEAPLSFGLGFNGVDGYEYTITTDFDTVFSVQVGTWDGLEFTDESITNIAYVSGSDSIVIVKSDISLDGKFIRIVGNKTI